MPAIERHPVDILLERRKTSPNGAGHYHLADPYSYQIRVSINGSEIARSNNALILKEVGQSLYNPVFYFPKEDVRMDLLIPVEGYTTHCPIKGEASYWSFRDGETLFENVAWGYDNALDYSEMIAGYVAFDQSVVTLEISPIVE